MQENLDREKKVRADVEKVKRKLETDLKATQEAVEELDRIKKELEDTVRRSVPLEFLPLSHTCLSRDMRNREHGLEWMKHRKSSDGCQWPLPSRVISRLSCCISHVLAVF